MHEYENWCTRIVHTLDKWSANYWHASSVQTLSVPGASADVEAVWVIAGSTGGVGAAAEFFSALTHVPPVAFIYAQHIHANQQSMLTAVGHSNADLVFSLAVGRHWLNPGHVLIVPAACRLEFSNQGEVFSIRDNWGTEETPNIDRLMMTMSGMRPSPAGAIILSGAGSDGTEGLRALHAVGTRIWAQDPATAVSPSMPQSAVSQGLVSQCANPRVLAAEFMRLYPHGKG
jgi:chemotaxis response regulator CheB